MRDASCGLLAIDLRRAERLRTQLPDPETLEALAGAARALADPTRLHVALALRGGDELCVCDLAWITGRSDKLASHHARALKMAGLARSRREGKMVLYTLSDRGRALVAALETERHPVPA